MDFKSFLTLPVDEAETWQGGGVTVLGDRDLPTGIDENRLGMALWVSVPSNLVCSRPIDSTTESQTEGLLAALSRFNEEQQFSSRPARIECNDQELVDRLSSVLKDSGTRVVFNDEMVVWNLLKKMFLNQFEEQFEAARDELSSGLPTLSESNCSDELIREFAEAAAAFYQAAPWQYLDDSDLIEIKMPKPLRNLKYAAVLGAGAETYGLGFYEDADNHYDLMAERADPLQLDLVGFTFESQASVNPKDLALWKQLDLPLETGEAYPTLLIYSGGKSRSPTVKELNHVIIVLKTLAVTSEDELDTGHWTKTVEHLGKRKRCVLTIPNLLDPPDHQEWMRRGKIPETRSIEFLSKQMQELLADNDGDKSIEELNTALKEKFQGPIDHHKPTANTAAERAVALCQDALETFGRRRIVLAKQALAENPLHVEAQILLAESTHDVDRRIEQFCIAKKNAKTELGEVFEESVGHFWGLVDTRPYMRSCAGLANSYHASGQIKEAVQQFQEMLHLNPDDNQGVHDLLILLLLELHHDQEAEELLNAYREETAAWHYSHALLAFRQYGHSTTSEKAMQNAIRSNEHVVSILQSNEPLWFPQGYSLGSPDEAASCINDSIDVWDLTEGFFDWMFQVHSEEKKSKQGKLRDKQQVDCKKSPESKQ